MSGIYKSVGIHELYFTPSSQKLTQRGWSEKRRIAACRKPWPTGGVIVAP